jgi:transcription-repair coupling factor (superfamily II helicase)
MSRRATSARKAPCCRSATTFSPNRAGLIAHIHDQAPLARVRPDQKVVFFDDWETPAARLKGATAVLRALVGIAEKGAKAA